jgi:oxaloacetate decarboxylase alpha subunit
MALPIAPILDRTGFCTIDLTGSSMFEVMIRHCREDPWEGLDLLLDAMPRTRVRAGMRTNASVTFGVTPDALMDIWMRQLNRHGCRSFWIYDVLYNIDKMHRLAKLAKEFGAQVAGSIMYTLSPVHDDAYFAAKAKEIASSPDIDSLLLYDTGGVLDKERMSTLIPAIKAVSNGKPLELHSNNLLGVSGKIYMDAIEFGVDVLHTASRPMANGASVPSTEIMAHNLEVMGHTHNLDTSLFAPVAEHMEAVGKAAGFAVNQYSEYDVLSLKHQIPGGMMGTLKAQLAQHAMTEKLPEVLKEVAVVRKELGYPIMATPFSQLVGIQAVLNIVTGKRYSIVPDEVLQYAYKYYGEPPAPIDPNVMDMIMASDRAKEVGDNPPPQPTEAELRKQYGTDDDDELILKALIPQPDIDAMRAAGPVRRDYPLLSSSELDEVRKLMTITSSPVVQVRSDQFNLTLRRGG